MSANNRRVRRLIVDLLWEFGEMTKEEMAEKLTTKKNVRTVPSPHSLSALLSKNPQIIAVGSEKVENAVGIKASHLVYDIDRNLIHNREEIVYTRSPTVMTPKQKKHIVQISDLRSALSLSWRSSGLRDCYINVI